MADAHVRVVGPAADPREPGGDDALRALQRLMATASGKWCLPVLDRLAARPARYNALLAALDDPAPKVLTQTLRRLEAEGLLTSRSVGRIGRQYALTPRGALLREHLRPMRRWAAQLTGPERLSA